MLEGIQSGNHHLRISHDGFDDYITDVICDGKPQRVIAELRVRGAQSSSGIPMPGGVSIPRIEASPAAPTRGFANTGDHAEPDKTIIQSWGQTGSGNIFVDSQPAKRSFFSPLVITGLAVIVVFFLGAAGLAGAYMLGFFRTTAVKPPVNNVPANTSSSPAPPSVPDIKPDLVQIPGGKFMMGRDDGSNEREKPQHPVIVDSFMLGRNEVTNQEYYGFVADTGRQQIPDDWVNGKPRPAFENAPVRFVNMEDVNAFIQWRSKRDGVTYRLPTEEEWEYAARNGSKGNMYPWGDSYQSKCAVMEEPSKMPMAVGSHTCPDDWGVNDLIGNVFEWTSSTPALYPGNKGKMIAFTEPYNMIRGGSYYLKPSGPPPITSTFRIESVSNKRSGELGFRLARSQ
jgi:formylglycine-generating enzyme required for sulfatase activity